MTVDRIRRHFVATLGSDVAVTVKPLDPPEILIYRPDPLADDFVALAFHGLDDAAPDLVAGVDHVLVEYVGSLGRARKRVRVRPNRFEYLPPVPPLHEVLEA